MKLYDNIIKDTLDLLSPYPYKEWTAGEKLWTQSTRNEVLFSSDAAYELGGGKESAAFTVITATENLIPAGKIRLYGNDLNEIIDNTPFARLVFIQTEEFGQEDASDCYNAVKEIEYIIYGIFLKGYMTRVSPIERKEQVRIAKSAIRDGISFETVGNALIKKFKQNPRVASASVIFVTDNLPVFKRLSSNAAKIDDITLALNKVLNDIDFDCGSCNLKFICDAVEGMKELHFKKK